MLLPLPMIWKSPSFICYATLRDKTTFDEPAGRYKKMIRQAFAMPA